MIEITYQMHQAITLLTTEDPLVLGNLRKEKELLKKQYDCSIKVTLLEVSLKQKEKTLMEVQSFLTKVEKCLDDARETLTSSSTKLEEAETIVNNEKDIRTPRMSIILGV